MTTALPPIRVVMGHYALRIYFGDVLHLYIQRSQLGPFQAWRDGPNHFSIEYHLNNGQKILTEYDHHEKWKTILAGLDQEAER